MEPGGVAAVAPETPFDEEHANTPARPRRLMYSVLLVGGALVMSGHRRELAWFGLAGILANFPHLLTFVALGRAFGITIEHLGLGLGGAFARFTIGWLTVRLNWVPLGGYVKFDQTPGNPGAYMEQAVWKRVVHPLSGPLVLVVIGLVLLGPTAWVDVFRRDVWDYLTLWLHPRTAGAEKVIAAYRFMQQHSFGLIFGKIATFVGASNLLPLPIMNGGMAVQAVIEGFLGRPIRQRTLTLVQLVSLLAMAVLFFCWVTAVFTARSLPV